MKRLTLLLIATSLLASCGAAPATPSDGNSPPIVGGDRDEHGCIGSAGYSWCAPKQKCLRPWEEECFATAFEALASQLAQKYGDSQKQITLTIQQQTLTHARATVRFGPKGTPGGIILAKKSGGQWLIVFEGNGSVNCEALKADEFPADMLNGMCD